MWSVEDPSEQSALQHDGLRRTVPAILDLVQAEAAYVPQANIFLAGISQGFAAAVAAYFAGGQPKLAGLVGLSSWMPLEGKDGLTQLFADVGTRLDVVSLTPIVLFHSSDDNVVPVRNGRALREALEQSGQAVEWHEYEDGRHWVNEPQGVDDMVSFLKRNMRE